MILFVDTETRSTIDLSCGVHRYSEVGEVILLGTQWSHGPNDHGTLTSEDMTPQRAKQLQYQIDQPECEQVVMHSAEFDTTMLARHDVHVPLKKRYCTIGQARRHGLPGALEKLCEIFSVSEDAKKLKDGRALINLFCKPKKDGTFNDARSHPVQWWQFQVYLGNDVSAMREIYYKMPKWNDALERPIWELDQVLNTRGFAVDTIFAQAAVTALSADKETLDSDMVDASLGMVDRGTQRDRLLKHILAFHKVELPDLTVSTLERRLKDERLPDEVRELIRIRMESSRTSTSKYSTLLKCVSSDGRLRGAKTYYGASRTGRWAAQKFQSDNMPRPSMPSAEVLLGVRAIRCGLHRELGIEPLSKYAAEGVRGTVIARPHHTLLVSDLANIEGRGTAWLADEEDALEAFRDHDAGLGPDTYRVEYARCFGLADPSVVTGLERQIGKVLKLMMGYGGAVGAFVTGAANYKIDLTEMAEKAWPTLPRGRQLDGLAAYARAVLEDETFELDERVYATCWALSRIWRAANPKIVELWGDMERAAKWTAVDGTPRQVGKILFDKEGAWLRMRLPSGRFLCYPSPRVTHNELTFFGVNPYSKKWTKLSTWGGTLVENAAQALSRDVLAAGLLRAQAAGLNPVLHVHDEIICEVPTGAHTVKELDACLAHALPWSAGLPLVAKGFETDRYYKEL
jgi:DNA polymerase bacteriophage-type